MHFMGTRSKNVQNSLLTTNILQSMYFNQFILYKKIKAYRLHLKNLHFLETYSTRIKIQKLDLAIN